MMKKILIVLIMLALINLYISCYRQVIKAAIDTKTNDVELYIVDREARELIFEANMYRFKGDTLDGFGRIVLFGQEQEPVRIKIALNDITEVQSREKEFEGGKTFLLAMGIIILSGVIFYVSVFPVQR
jgi:hypothetical protein